MIKTTSLIACCAVAFSASAQSDVLNEQFNDETLPASFYTRNYDGMGFQKRAIGSDKLMYYSGIVPEKTWFVSTVDDGNGVTSLAALSASHRDNPDKATDNWLYTPVIEIKNGMLLRWDARSVHKGFPERYEVKVSESSDTDPASFETIFTSEGETYPWSTHIVDLSKFAGKKVRIAFVHNATNTYMLAIDNIRVGELTDRKLSATNHSRHFLTEETNPDRVLSIDLRLFNNGRELNIKKVYAEVDEVEVAVAPLKDFTIPRASYLDMTLPLDLGEKNHCSYTVKALLDNDAIVTLSEDAVWLDKNRRTLVAEKFTGAWCTACPRLTPLCQKLEAHFGNELVLVEPHFFYPGVTDDLANPSYGGEYGGALTFSDYPTMIFNRNRRQKMNALKPKVLTPLTSALEEPVVAGMYLQAVNIHQPGIVRLVSYVTPSENIDNSADNYRVAFAAVREENMIDNVQQNGAALLGFDFSEYHILPGTIPGDAIVHFNVPVGVNEPEGIAKSLPAEMEAGKTYSSTYLLEFPEEIDFDELKFVSYLIKTDGTFEILNAAQTHSVADSQTNVVIHSADRLEAGEEMPLEVRYVDTPSGIEWKTSDPSVATVENGVVKALSAGKVTLTAVTPEGETNHSINVYDNEPVMLVLAPDATGSVSEVATEGENIRVILNGRELKVAFASDADYLVELFSVDGIRQSAFTGSGTTASIDLSSYSAGLNLIRVSQKGESATFKVLLK